MADVRSSIDLSTFPDLSMRKSVGTPKASPTTSTSTRFYSLIERNRKKKKLRKKLDPVLDSQEFKLLCKLYLPKRYQTLTDLVVSMKALPNYLPVLLPSDDSSVMSYPKLNMELHLFLANIVAGYVSSWYGKLNTDNDDFIRSVYNVMCDFVKGLSKRFSVLLNSDNLITRLDDMCLILDDHLDQLVGQNDLKVVEDRQPGLILATFDRNEIIHEYVTSKHIIFNETERLGYFRILVKQLLITTLTENSEDEGPLNTDIGLKFVDSVIADLVLEKVMQKLGDPQFVLSVIMRISMKIKAKMSDRSAAKARSVGTKTKLKPIRDRIRSMVSKSYKDLSYLLIMRGDGSSQTDDNILYNKAFALVDRILGISKRKPLVAGILGTLRDIVYSHQALVGNLNPILKKTVFKASFMVVNDELLANIISSLRYAIFKRDDEESVPVPILTVSDVASEIYDIWDHPSISTIKRLLEYLQDSKEDTLECIKATLKVFESLDLNQWLIIKIIDDLVANLYPSLVVQSKATDQSAKA